jgi:hypothetical protein
VAYAARVCKAERSGFAAKCCFLMLRMGIEAIYRRKNTSRPHPEHAVFPYLLRRLTIERSSDPTKFGPPT